MWQSVEHMDDIVTEIVTFVHNAAEGDGLSWVAAWKRMWRCANMSKSFYNAVHVRAKHHVHFMYDCLASFTRLPPLSLDIPLDQMLRRAITQRRLRPSRALRNEMPRFAKLPRQRKVLGISKRTPRRIRSCASLRIPTCCAWSSSCH